MKISQILPLLLLPLAGCLGGTPADGSVRFDATTLEGISGTLDPPFDSPEKATFSWQGTTTIQGHDGKRLQVYEVEAQIGDRQEWYFLDAETFEPIAWTDDLAGAYYSGPSQGDLWRLFLFAPLHWSNQDLAIGRHEFHFLGMAGELVVASKTSIKMQFPLLFKGEESPSYNVAFTYTMKPSSSVPKRVEFAYEGKTRAAEQTVWILDEAGTGEAISAAPNIQVSRIPLQNVMPVAPWNLQPADATPSEMPYSPYQALEWAKQDSAEVRDFFARHPTAFLGLAALDTDSVGAISVEFGVELGRQWSMEWFAPGETLKFGVRWDMPIPGAPIELARHEMVYVSTEENTIKSIPSSRPPMVAWSDAYARCTETIHPLGLSFLYEDDNRHSGGIDLEHTLGGREQDSPARYACRGAFAFSAYTGLLVGAVG